MTSPRHVEAGPRASGPTIKRGSSSGDIWTPWEFIRAVEDKFGLLWYDLAATDASAKAVNYITAERDCLLVEWSALPLQNDRHSRLLWLNPPYSNITPWAKKCAEESQNSARILLLVPGSIGANWYWNFVEPFADVYSVGRMVFDNCFDKDGNIVTTPYPKDLILCHYDSLLIRKPMQRWKWK